MSEKYDYTAFGVLIEHFSFENEQFSSQMATLILRGLNKASYDEARPYLEAMTYFLNIRDDLQIKRIEWIIGYPQPLIQPARQGGVSFGMFGNNSIDEVVYVYGPTLIVEGCNSVLDIILTNRRRLENMCAVCLRQLLLLCDLNPTVFEYVASLPAPSYNYAKFTDWIRAFLEGYIADAKKYYYGGGFPKEETGNETLKFFNAFEEKLNKKIQKNEEIITGFRGGKKAEAVEKSEVIENGVSQNNEKAVPVLKSVLPIFVIGETKSEEKLQEIQLLQTNPGVTLVENQVYAYIRESKPTGTTNLAFPPSIVRENYLATHQVRPDSGLAHFIRPMQSGSDNQPKENKLEGKYLFNSGFSLKSVFCTSL